MSTSRFIESVVEDTDLDRLAELSWIVSHGTDIAPDVPRVNRASANGVAQLR